MMHIMHRLDLGAWMWDSLWRCRACRSDRRPRCSGLSSSLSLGIDDSLLATTTCSWQRRLAPGSDDSLLASSSLLASFSLLATSPDSVDSLLVTIATFGDNDRDVGLVMTTAMLVVIRSSSVLDSTEPSLVLFHTRCWSWFTRALGRGPHAALVVVHTQPWSWSTRFAGRGPHASFGPFAELAVGYRAQGRRIPHTGSPCTASRVGVGGRAQVMRCR